MIEGVQAEYPDAIFSFRGVHQAKDDEGRSPRRVFTQSYSYFTWRNNKAELIEYFTELTQTEMKDYYRANLFPQHAGHPALLPSERRPPGGLLIRATLAATLSSVYGIYSGFELCENAALPGREEYYDSEKYQFKGRDWNAPRQHQGTHYPPKPRPGARTARCKGTTTCVSCPAITTRSFFI